MNKSDWTWMPHPGHFIGGNNCRFHLNTYVGEYIVSTVGEYLPDSAVREILAKSRGIELEGKGDYREYDYLKKNGYEKLGLDRLYETMVFKAGPSKDPCCPFRATDFSNLDFDGYNTPEDAFKGHLAMCDKWSQKDQEPN
jgi:hypothetical protein